MTLERISDIVIEENKDVYSPDEDTFLLLDLIQIDEGEDILEIGCGTGMISIHCAYHGANVTAVDVNEKAVELTSKNAEINDIDLKDILFSDMFSEVQGMWDAIIFNPPYLPKVEGYPMDVRWDGGIDGDETIVKFLERSYSYLCPEGRVYFCCSDLAPLTRIYNTIDMGYEIIEQREKTFDFETIYAFSLIAMNHSSAPFI